MSKDTQNAVLVLLSIVVVLVTVIGGGYWCLNYGEDIFNKFDRENKTIVPNKKTKLENGEYSVSLDDNVVMVLIEKIPNNRNQDIVSEDIIYKTAYARNIVSNKDDYMNIYEYYAYKEVLKDENDTILGYKYYSDKDKTNLITESVEDVDIFETNSDNVGIYKYSFKYDNRKGYVFENSEKVR